MGLLTGFIEGSVTYDDSGTLTLLPFQDTIEEATFEYNGELIFSETFSNRGIKGASAACFHKEEAKFLFNTTNINWAFLQTAMAQRDEARTAPVPVSQTLVAVANMAAVQVTLDFTPTTGTPITVANGDGVQFTGTATGAVVTIAGGTAGDSYTVAYFRDAGTDERSIEIGKNEKIRENAIYGRFYGCPDELLIVARRAVIQPSVSMGVGDNAAEAGLEAMCLRDEFGVFASIIRIDP
jgi:hypothetical protein